jgi:hypothetical protein
LVRLRERIQLGALLERGSRDGGEVVAKLRMSPAMAPGVSDRLWEVADIVALVEAEEAKTIPAKRGPYKKNREEISN